MKKDIKKIVTHGRTFTGVVISDKMHKTVNVEWISWKHVPKFERFEKARTRIKAHNIVDAKTGDIVSIKECRPLSKTKHFVVTEILDRKDKSEVKK